MGRKKPEYKVSCVYKTLPPEEEERRSKEVIEILARIILQYTMKTHVPQTEEGEKPIQR